ncbi:MAG: class I SAM-dependent methyltransferase [Georgfuchsia sp.]
MTEHPVITWNEGDGQHIARWRSENNLPPPEHVEIADDTMTANAAYRLACEGTALLWRGDFHNARQLLQAMARRTERNQGLVRSSGKRAVPAIRLNPIEAFNQQRQVQGQRARILGMLLLPFNADHGIPLRRAPNVRQACNEAYGTADEPYVASLRELQGLIGAHEWRKKGVEVATLDARIHPHYGVFAPIRSEYVGLVATAPLPAPAEQITAFDIGTGTGVLAAVLAQRGIRRIIATDINPRALDCARENLARLGLGEQVDVVNADLFPAGQAELILCNPPWVPAQPNSALEYAVYDPDSRMLRGFLAGLTAHLAPGGEGWLILSDLAEHLGLRTRDELLAMIAAAELKVIGRLEAQPKHPRAMDKVDPLHAARAKELTSLWRLAAQ